jgi:hypothetical protein
MAEAQKPGETGMIKPVGLNDQPPTKTMQLPERVGFDELRAKANTMDPFTRAAAPGGYVVPGIPTVGSPTVGEAPRMVTPPPRRLW